MTLAVKRKNNLNSTYDIEHMKGQSYYNLISESGEDIVGRYKKSVPAFSAKSMSLEELNKQMSEEMNPFTGNILNFAQKKFDVSLNIELVF